MIQKEALAQFIDERLAGTDYFLVDIAVSAQNEIKIEIDSMTSVDIDFCIDLSKAIEEAFPRDPEDYELEVGSAGFTSPFKVRRQYEKNIGHEIEVLTLKGEKLRGILRSLSDDAFTLDVRVKVRPEGAKRPVEQVEGRSIPFSDVKSARIIFEF